MTKHRFFILAFGLLATIIMGATRFQSLINTLARQDDGQMIHAVHLDRMYLRKFTTRLSQFWINSKSGSVSAGLALERFEILDD